ncbi:hypothetical protein CP968_22170 [Streptomyces subrutilus]|uniref:Uncharacterized protein n=1 Tax=Streptomyces subrutilus TaxID=36818 RepID=A0A5P2UMY4_9ACTN|nr:hypothetical protein CP968_22170 [Streptomyces subrutilus]
MLSGRRAHRHASALGYGAGSGGSNRGPDGHDPHDHDRGPRGRCHGPGPRRRTLRRPGRAPRPRLRAPAPAPPRRASRPPARTPAAAACLIRTPGRRKAPPGTRRCRAGPVTREPRVRPRWGP